MKNNKGFTLVELVVVIAISGILLTTVGLTLSSVFSNKTKAASKTIYNMLGNAQNMGMSREECYLALIGDDKNNFTASIVTKNADKKLVSVQDEDFSKVAVQVEVGSNTFDIDSSFGILIKIDRTTGGFISAFKCGVGYNNISNLGSPCSKIIIKSDSKDYTICLSPKTGKFYYE